MPDQSQSLNYAVPCLSYSERMTMYLCRHFAGGSNGLNPRTGLVYSLGPPVKILSPASAAGLMRGRPGQYGFNEISFGACRNTVACA